MNETLVKIGRMKKTINLFDTEGGEVTLYTSPTSDEQMEIAIQSEGHEDLASRAKVGLDMVVKCFIDWNIAGEDGSKLPCTRETLGMFSNRDLFAMLQVVTGRPLLDEKGNMLSEDEIAKKAVSA